MSGPSCAARSTAYAAWSTGCGRSSWTTSVWSAPCGSGSPPWNDPGRSGPEVHLDLPDALPPLSAAVELAAYRIVLEALANVARHARAGHCEVRIRRRRTLVVTVDATGPPPSDWSAGVGLRSIVDRAEELGGSASAGPYGQGWRVQALLPLPTD